MQVRRVGRAAILFRLFGRFSCRPCEFTSEENFGAANSKSDNSLQPEGKIEVLVESPLLIRMPGTVRKRMPRWFGLIPVAIAFLLMTLWTWRKWPDILVDFGQQ